MGKSYRRIRVGQCPYCKEDTRIDLKPPIDKNIIPHTVCEKCFCVFANSMVDSRLVEHDVHYKLT